MNRAERAACRLATLDQTRDTASRRLPRAVFDVIDGGAEREVTARLNLEAFEKVRWLHRAATAAVPTTTTMILGAPAAFPLVLAPCGLVGAVHPAAEPAVARAAARAGIPAAFSTCSSSDLETIASLGGSGPKWFQLYFAGGRAGAAKLIDRAERAGYTALVVTVDTPVSGHRERDARHRLILGMDPYRMPFRDAAALAPSIATHPGWAWRFARSPWGARMGNLSEAQAQSIFLEPPTWSDLDWIRTRWSGPLIVKGVLTPQDARRAVDHGADAVVVSNHGGRQLDGLPASLEVLPSIVSAIGGSVEVLLDGGIRRGSDIAKAIALGATAVLAGRAYLYGLAAAGEPGVDRVLTLLKQDLARTMTLLGCESVADLDQHLGAGAHLDAGSICAPRER